MAKILVVGLNPAWQQVFRLPAYRHGGVSRADAFWNLGSGKGLNAAKILARRGHAVSLLQVLAGENGRRVREACSALGVRSLDVETAGETRVCTTLLHDGVADEIIAPFALPDAAGRPIADELIAHVQADDGYDALLVCGSAPPGIPESLHAEVVACAGAPLVVWDSVSGLTPDVLSAVSWIKINAAELTALEPMLAASSSGRAARPGLFVTDGAAAARLREADAGSAWACVPPKVEGTVNPIGAGDTATAVFVDCLLHGLEPREAASRALAAASASCLHPLPAEWDPVDAERFEREVRWENGKWEMENGK